MKRLLMTTGLLALGALSFGQHSGIDATNLSIRLGGAYPFEKSTRTVTGKMIGLGFDLSLSKGFSRDADSYVSLDWLMRSTSGAKGNIVPLMFNQRFYMDNANLERSARSYFFAGVGLVMIDIVHSKTVLGGRFGAGHEFNKNVFLEGTVLLSSDADGAKANSVGLYLGYRF